MYVHIAVRHVSTYIDVKTPQHSQMKVIVSLVYYHLYNGIKVWQPHLEDVSWYSYIYGNSDVLEK